MPKYFPPNKPPRAPVTKTPATIEEQLAKLRQRGCVIEDEAFAAETLKNINYFRLAYYFAIFLEDKSRYKDGTSFNKVLGIYDFDRRMRNLLLEVLEEIEIALRAHCSNFHAMKYGATGYLNADTFGKNHKHQPFLSRIDRLLDANSDSGMVTHYVRKYNGAFPLWTIMELFSFGSLNMFFSDLKPADKSEIADTFYDCASGTLENWLQCLSDLRNHCAHYHRLYGNVPGAPPKTPADAPRRFTDSVYDYIYVMKRLYRRPDSWKNGFCKQLGRLVFDFEQDVDLAMLGFPENWREELLVD